MAVTEDRPTWATVRERITGLWPKYQPTDAERALIANRLSSLRMDWLNAAVESYRCADSSTVFRLADLLEHYRRIANSGSSQAAPRAESAETRRARQEDERKAEAEAARAWLLTQPRTNVAQAVQSLRAMRMLGSAQLPARVQDWSDSQALMVLARCTMPEGWQP